MKIIAILEDEIEVGGGYNQSLNAILQMQRICKDRFEFGVFTNKKNNCDALAGLGIHSQFFSLSLVEKLVLQVCLFPWWHQLQGRLKWVGSFERQLKYQGCDLVYFVKQTDLSAILQTLNFITTLFDLCHRDALEFPEVREYGRFQAREYYFNTRLTGAVAVLTDSPALAELAAIRYGVDRDRLLPMPFAPAPFLESQFADDTPSVLRKYGLAAGYLFYPAQFWAHKNHIRILEALLILKRRGRRERVVFAGGDKGNLAHLMKFTDENGLTDYVRILGFVPAGDMLGLYLGCSVVVMPTYFGPTNMPPLEAWLTGRPLIYSSLFRDQAGDAAICVDPDDAEGLALAIEASLQSEIAAKLIECGADRLRQIKQQRTDAELELIRRLRRFASRRECWE